LFGQGNTGMFSFSSKKYTASSNFTAFCRLKQIIFLPENKVKKTSAYSKLSHANIGVQFSYIAARAPKLFKIVLKMSVFNDEIICFYCEIPQ
jgi:hypothetical protein